MFRSIEFILLYEGSDACLPACDTKPQGLLKLISDEVPHRFIELILQSDPQRSPANVMRHGCQTEIVLLCQTQDLAVKAMFDTGSSPGNYMSHAFFHANAGVLQD